MDQALSQSHRRSASISFLFRLYYQCKHLIPRRIRLAMRKAHASKILASGLNDWPICEASAQQPANWPGWPDGRQFAFVLTHDVEGTRGLERIREIAELEMELGFRSTFNFIPEGSYQVSPELRRWLVEHGFEVGVHDLHHDGNLYSSESSFKRKAARVNDYLKEWDSVGFRSGFMLHNLDWARELNVLWEASTFDTDPFEPQPDGTHTIFPFWVAGTKNDMTPGNGRSQQGYVELPYTLPQDSTLFIHLGHRSIDLWKRKVDWIAQKGGMALMILHPDYASSKQALAADEFPIRFYREFLEYVRGEYGGAYWHALPREVATHCKQAWLEEGSELPSVQ